MNDCGDVKLNNGNILGCKELTFAARSMYKDIESALTRLSGQKSILEIPKNMVDNYRNNEYGASLISVNLEKVKPHISTVLHSMLGKATEERFKKDIASMTLEELFRIGMDLLILMHLVYGSPARSTGLGAIKWFNCDERRNIFVDGNLICVAVKSIKNLRSTGKGVVYRFLPKSVSNLVYHYVVMRHVVHQKLTGMNFFDETNLPLQPYIIRQDSHHLRERFRNMMEIKLGYPVLFSEFRQFMSFILRVTVMDDVMTARLNESIASQAGRSVATDTMNYGLSSQYLPKTSTVTKYQNKRISSMWQMRLGLE